MRRPILILLALAVPLGLSTAGAQEVRFGQGGNITWEGEVSKLQGVSTIQPEFRPSLNPNTTAIGVAPDDRIELAHPDYPDAILPIRLDEGENLSASLVAEGGSIVSETAVEINKDELAAILQGLLSPKSTGTAFERKGTNILGTLLTVDLGAIVGVNRIRFFPRNTFLPSPTTPFQNDFLRNFELRIHDGLHLNEAGLPALGTWESFLTVNGSTEPVTVVEIDPPRYLRFVRLRASSSIPFEIEKLQIFGEGFFPTAQYLSPIVDLGTPSNWGQIRWTRNVLGEEALTGLIVRTRTGSDSTPFVYNRREVGNPNAEDIPFSIDNPGEPLSRAEFLDLPVKGTAADPYERGSIRDDLDNWSPWSPPYSAADGSRITSPAPHTYIQFRVDFLSRGLHSSQVLNGVAFKFTKPALADALIAEVFPRTVEAARAIAFVYAVRAEMERSELQGFNGFELFTQGRVERIARLEIVAADGQRILDHTFETQDRVADEGDAAITSITDEGFAVRFPRIETDGTILKIHFVNRVLAYSSDFGGRALVQGTEAFQWVQAGNAAALDEKDASFDSGITVLSPAVTHTGLIGNFALDTPVFTPNRDGVHDGLRLRFEVLTVVGEADIQVALFDVSGRRRATIFEHRGGNGTYTRAGFSSLNWDGRNDQGELLPPGVYLVRLEVGGDARSTAAVRSVGIAY